MGDTEAVIRAALDSARESGDLDTGGDVEVETDTSDVEVTETETTTTEEETIPPHIPNKGEEDVTPLPKPESKKKEAKKPEESKEVKPVEEDDYDGSDPEENKRRAGKDNRIPHTEISRISTNREKKSNLAVAEALGLPGIDAKTYRKETFQSALTAFNEEVRSMRQESKDFATVKPVMLNNADAFMKYLTKVNPDYANFVRKGADTKEAKAEPELPDEKDDPRPKADIEVTLPDGKKGMTYSDAAHQKLMEYYERRATRRAKAEMKAEFDQRLSPFEQERQTKEQLATEQQTYERMVEFELKRARRRPQFKENEEEIRQAVTIGEFSNLPFSEALDSAYDKIVLGKLMTNYDDLYKRVNGDIKKKATSTSVTNHSNTKKKDDDNEGIDRDGDGDNDSTTVAIRKALNQARKSGALK